MHSMLRQMTGCFADTRSIPTTARAPQGRKTLCSARSSFGENYIWPGGGVFSGCDRPPSTATVAPTSASACRAPYAAPFERGTEPPYPSRSGQKGSLSCPRHPPLVRKQLPRQVATTPAAPKPRHYQDAETRQRQQTDPGATYCEPLHGRDVAMGSRPASSMVPRERGDARAALLSHHLGQRATSQLPELSGKRLRHRTVFAHGRCGERNGRRCRFHAAS